MNKSPKEPVLEFINDISIQKNLFWKKYQKKICFGKHIKKICFGKHIKKICFGKKYPKESVLEKISKEFVLEKKQNIQKNNSSKALFLLSKNKPNLCMKIYMFTQYTNGCNSLCSEYHLFCFAETYLQWYYSTSLPNEF